MVEIIDGGVTTPQGFKAAGVHSGVKYRSLDLAVLYSEVPASAFVGYTSNNVKAAPVQVMMKENSPKLQAVVVNSGNANALTGRRGIEDAIAMKQAVAAELSLDPLTVGVMSTGLIGRFMDMHKIRYGISRACRELSQGREADGLLAEAIMTTDTIKKECSARVRLGDGTLVYIGAISKGSGMIEPHLKVLHGTTLSLVTTDANLSPEFAETWQSILDDSMNMVSVDGDQSTNDTCILMANGMSKGAVADKDPEFIEALRTVMTRIARTIAMDGEGATKLIEVQVTGAETKDDARKLVKTIINSPLVKSAIFGSDPNYGRIMMALGNSGCKFVLEDVRLTIKGGDMEVPILDSGAPVFQDERSVEVVRMAMDNKEVTIAVDLGAGNETATGWGCDLTYDYVRINAEYATRGGWMENIYLLKFGGNALRGRDDMSRLSREIAQLIRDGARIILVHGGGPEISEEMEKRGLTPKKIAGVRVTDAAGLEVAELVLRRINSDVVACLKECGVEALGIPGYFCTVCRKKAPVKAVEDGVEQEVDLGLVGEVEAADPSSILDLLEQGITPVIYPIGKDAEGKMLNVNADTMAAGIAAGVECKEMIAITDVPGILRDVSDPSSKINELTLAEVDRLMEDGTISGGMIPKVEACRSALLAGVSAVRMVNGKDPRSIVSDVMMKDNHHGTIITK